MFSNYRVDGDVDETGHGVGRQKHCKLRQGQRIVGGVRVEDRFLGHIATEAATDQSINQQTKQITKNRNTQHVTWCRLIARKITDAG